MKILKTSILAVGVIAAMTSGSFWAASGLPQVDNAFVKSTCATVGLYSSLRAYPLQFSYKDIVDSVSSEATLNMDGTWSYDRLRLMRTMTEASSRVSSMLSPHEIGWRLLLASPFVANAGATHADYVATHPKTWNCKKDHF